MQKRLIQLFAAIFALMLLISVIGCGYRGGETGINPKSGNGNRVLTTPIPPNMGREGVNVRLHGNSSSYRNPSDGPDHFKR